MLSGTTARAPSLRLPGVRSTPSEGLPRPAPHQRALPSTAGAVPARVQEYPPLRQRFPETRQRSGARARLEAARPEPHPQGLTGLQAQARPPGTTAPCRADLP